MDILLNSMYDYLQTEKKTHYEAISENISTFFNVAVQNNLLEVIGSVVI